MGAKAPNPAPKGEPKPPASPAPPPAYHQTYWLPWAYRRPLLAGPYWWQAAPTVAPILTELHFAPERGWYWTYEDFECSEESHAGGRWAGPLPSPNGYALWLGR